MPIFLCVVIYLRPIQIVVQVTSSADVKRLEKADDDLKFKVQRLNEQIEALHRLYFECLNLIHDLKDNKN